LRLGRAGRRHRGRCLRGRRLDPNDGPERPGHASGLGPCADQAYEIGPGFHLDYIWTASVETTESRGSWQRLQVPVYPSADAAAARTGGRIVTADFTLPPAQDLMIVDLTAP